MCITPKQKWIKNGTFRNPCYNPGPIAKKTTFIGLFWCLLHKQFRISFKDGLGKLHASESFGLLCQKLLKGSSVLPIFVSFIQMFFPDFSHFRKGILSVIVFSKSSQIRGKFCSHDSVNLFIKILSKVSDICGNMLTGWHCSLLKLSSVTGWRLQHHGRWSSVIFFTFYVILE